MSVAVMATSLGAEDGVLYMLHWGDHDESSVNGPYRGAPGLDFDALAENYRREHYAAAEAAREDTCYVDESGFSAWLLAKGILTPVATKIVHVSVRGGYDYPYVPKHWPECPECSEGRGDLEYGAVRRSLNRIETFRKCTQCQYEWGHEEAANNSKLPMLDDDGRDTVGGCVPFAISKACGVDFATVRQVCERHGWTPEGMGTERAVVAARELGFVLVKRSTPAAGQKLPTLKQVMLSCTNQRNYILGLKGHWLALVGGQLVDNDNNSGLASRVVEIYEVQKQQAVAG